MKSELLVRFLTSVRFGDGCWIWLAAQHNGYGTMSLPNKKQIGAHRWAWEYFRGPIPKGLVIDHVRDRGCTSKLCVNPDHLEPVTIGVNVMRGFGPVAQNPAKTHCPQNHEYTEANTYLEPGGARKCRECNKLRDRVGRARKFRSSFPEATIIYTNG